MFDSNRSPLPFLTLPEGDGDSVLTRSDGQIIIYQLHAIGREIVKYGDKVEKLEDWRKDVDRERSAVKKVGVWVGTPLAAAVLGWFGMGGGK